MEDNYCHYYRDHSGQRATGIGLAAGLGGGALLLAIAGIWGVNKASEARSAGATTNAISVPGCQPCGRTFVSETPLTLTIA